jgi:hypothetical protein
MERPYNSANCIVGCYNPNGICEPEHGEWYNETEPLISCSDCLGYTFSLQEDVGSVPEFSGTAVILIFVLAVVSYAFISHFNKE